MLGETESYVNGLVERRRYFRIHSELVIRCSYVGSKRPDFTACGLDMSLGGVRLDVAQKIPFGTKLKLTVHDDKNDLNVVFAGSVVRIASKSEPGHYDVGIKVAALTRPRLKSLIALIGLETEAAAQQKRRLIRLNKQLAVNISDARNLLARSRPASIINISIGGMAVETDIEYKQGALCATEIFLPGKRDPVRLKARILEVHPFDDRKRWRIRLQFQAYGEEGLKRIARFLRDEIAQSLA